MKLLVFSGIRQVIQNILMVSLILEENLRAVNVPIKQETDLRMQKFLRDIISMFCLLF